MNPTEFQAAILDLYNKACQGTNATEIEPLPTFPE